MISRASYVSSPRSNAIAERIAAGLIPVTFPSSAVGNWGAGRPCAVCDDDIRADQPEVEAQFPDRTLPFHARCFVDWWRRAEVTGPEAAR